MPSEIQFSFKKTQANSALAQIKVYEKALLLHRLNYQQFYHPLKPCTLGLNGEQTAQILREARDRQMGVGQALKMVGLKRLKVLFKCGAIEHFNMMINYLEKGEVPSWMRDKHQELSQSSHN